MSGAGGRLLFQPVDGPIKIRHVGPGHDRLQDEGHCLRNASDLGKDLRPKHGDTKPVLKRLGVALVNISMGNPYASPHLTRPFEYPPPDGYGSPEHPLIGVDRHFRLAEELQRKFPDLPMVGSGYSYLREYLLKEKIFHFLGLHLQRVRL